MSVVGELRGMAGALRRRLRRAPEVAALRSIGELARRTAKNVPGQLRLLDLDLEFPDAHSFGPQWNDIFVRGSLRFTSPTPSPRVLDCGANVGLATLWLLRQYPSARITAFEADPQIAAMLRRNLAVNGASSVQVIEAALWSSTGVLPFRSEGSDSGAIDRVAGATPGTVIEVPSVRLRDWVARERVDLLKLDVEGAELELIDDCADVLANAAALQIEVHDFGGSPRLLPKCLLRLEELGFDYTLEDLHQASWRIDSPPAGPFGGVASWVIGVRAWRREARE